MSEEEKASSKAREKASELSRTLLGDQTIQMILSGLLEGSVSEMEPIFDSERIPRYAVVENVAKIDPVEARLLLEKMNDAGLLTRAFYERLTVCPYCKSPAGIFVHRKCPKCGNLDMDRLRIWEHQKCGALWVVKEAAAKQASCPRCKVRIDSDAHAFQLVGTNWLCDNCHTKSDRLDLVFFCRSCNKESHLDEVETLDIHSYKLNPNMEEKIQDALLLPVLRKTFEESGFKIDISGSLVGKSGVPQDFAMVARKEGQSVTVDLIQSNETMDVPQVLASCAKMTDVETDMGLLLAIPLVSDRAKSLASTVRLTVIEGKDAGELTVKLRKCLSEIGGG